MTAGFELADGVDIGRLGDALDVVISRHEPLRMRLLKLPDGSIQQEFRDTGQSARPAVQVVASIGPALADFQRQLPDITRDDPIRTAFFRDAETNKTVFAFHIDHMAIDGWGLELFIDELSKAYAARSGTVPVLPDLPLSFTEYVELERKAGVTVTDQQISYWTDLLVNSSPYELPSEIARTGADEAVQASVSSTVGAETTRELLALGRRLRVPMPALVIASTGVSALARSGASDVLLKNVYLGRDLPGTMKLIGCFTRTSFLRLELDRQLSVEQLIMNATRGWLDSATNSAAPFAVGRIFRHFLESGTMDFETVMRLSRSLTVNYFAFGKGMSPNNPVLGKRIPLQRQSAYSVRNNAMPLLVEVRVGDGVTVGSICNPERYRKDGVRTFLDLICAGLTLFASDLSATTGSVADAIASQDMEE